MCERTCARDREIEVNMTVKKEMSPDTVIKLRFDPSDTADVVYQRFNAKVQEVKNVLEDTSFGALAGAFHLVPGLLLKFLVWALQVSDYFGCLPSSITHLSHFHGSLYITSMGPHWGFRPSSITCTISAMCRYSGLSAGSGRRLSTSGTARWPGGGRWTAASLRTSGLWTDSISRSPCTVFRI